MAAGLLACSKPREAAVRVSIPDPDGVETPAAGIGVIALPYDRDSLLRAMAARARSPRPPTAVLDSLFREFRGPFTAYTRSTTVVEALRDSLSTAGRADSVRLRSALRAAESSSERARRALETARRRFAGRGDSLRAVVRRWEDSTYRGYDSLVDVLSHQRGAEAATDTTNATGWAHFRLAPGAWWLYARSWDAADPNAEWYWNVPVKADTVLLSSRTGRLKARY